MEEMDKNAAEHLTEPKEPQQSPMPIEGALEELEAIIKKLEDKDCSLEKSFAYYEKGMRMVKECSEIIDKTEKKIRILSEEGQNEEF